LEMISWDRRSNKSNITLLVFLSLEKTGIKQLILPKFTTKSFLTIPKVKIDLEITLEFPQISIGLST
jgi:hypothetical protein